MISTKSKNDLPFYISMVAPAIIFFIIIIAGPIIFSIGLSFTDYDFKPNQVANFAGFEQYKTMFTDPKFWLALKNNMFIVAVSVFGQIPLGFIMAYMLFRKTVKGTSFFQAMVFLPNVISTVIIGILWRNIFGIRGLATALVRNILQDPKFTFKWFMNADQAMIPIGIALLWIYTGFFMLVFLANLQKLDPQVIEAAHIDGASEIQTFFRIIVPALSGVIIVNAILAISGSLKGFDLIFALAPSEGMGIENNNLVLPTYLFHYAYKTGKFAFGSAISTIIISISVILILISTYFGKKLNPMED